MGLHLLGIRYKNYRNFEDVFINISSKYRTEVEDECRILDIYVYDKTHHHKTIEIKSIRVEELNNHKKNIRYKCIVGKNGTGKSTILTPKPDELYHDTYDMEYAEKVFYRLFIDENTKKIYALHNNDYSHFSFDKTPFVKECYDEKSKKWRKYEYEELFYASDEFKYEYKKLECDYEKLDESISCIVLGNLYDNIEELHLLCEVIIDSNSNENTDIAYVYYLTKGENESKFHRDYNLYLENKKIIHKWKIGNHNICYKLTFFNEKFENVLDENKTLKKNSNHEDETKIDKKAVIKSAIEKILKINVTYEEYLNDFKDSFKILLCYLFLEKRGKNKHVEYDTMINWQKKNECKVIDFDYILNEDLESVLKELVKDSEENDILKEVLIRDIEELGKSYYEFSQSYDIDNLRYIVKSKHTGVVNMPILYREIYYYFEKYDEEEIKDKLDNFFEKAVYMINKYPIFRLILSCDLENVSSGERECIELNSIISAYIDSIIKEGTKRNIILSLDEPDLHMHPEWIRKFKYYLDKTLQSKCEKNKDLTFQVNIATNSPFMVSDFKKDELIMLDFKKDSDYNITEVMESKSFFGANIYDILKESFFLDSAIGESAQEEINNMIEELKNIKDKSNKDEIIKGAKELNESIADVFIKDYISNLIMRAEYDNDIK